MKQPNHVDFVDIQVTYWPHKYRFSAEPPLLLRFRCSGSRYGQRYLRWQLHAAESLDPLPGLTLNGANSRTALAQAIRQALEQELHQPVVQFAVDLIGDISTWYQGKEEAYG